MVQYSEVQCGMVWCGSVWYGMVRSMYDLATTPLSYYQGSLLIPCVPCVPGDDTVSHHTTTSSAIKANSVQATATANSE